MKKFLTIKHWQLFIFLFCIPIIIQLAIVVITIINNMPELMLYCFPMLMLIYVVILFGWLYTLGTQLHKKLPSSVNTNLTLFKLFISVPTAYVVVVSMSMYNLFTNISVNEQMIPKYFLIILPIHLFSMFCIFYCLYFIAKTLKAVELQKKVNFSDCVGEFCLLWFFPIGIWILQPRINAIFATNNKNANHPFNVN